MKVEYTAEAFSSLLRLVNFIEETNTNDAGIRWLNKFESFIEKNLPNSATISFCNNESLRRFQLRCIYCADWIIAFSVHNNNILIEAILHKTRIKD